MNQRVRRPLQRLLCRSCQVVGVHGQRIPAAVLLRILLRGLIPLFVICIVRMRLQSASTLQLAVRCSLIAKNSNESMLLDGLERVGEGDLQLRLKQEQLVSGWRLDA